MQSASVDDAMALRASIASLSAEVLRLQTQLDEMHCSDTNALRYSWAECGDNTAGAIIRRAHTTLCQHVEALASETQCMDESVTILDSSACMRGIVVQKVRGGRCLASRTTRHTAPTGAAAERGTGRCGTRGAGHI